MGKIKVFTADEEGYLPQVRYSGWRVATITYSQCFDQANIKQLERHLLTDEVFVLVYGEAILYVQEEYLNKIPMVQGVIYNVTAGTWHAISLNQGAKVFIVENDSTSKDNSEYLQYFT